MAYSNITLLKIYYLLWQLQNFWNRSNFGELRQEYLFLVYLRHEVEVNRKQVGNARTQAHTHARTDGQPENIVPPGPSSGWTEPKISLHCWKNDKIHSADELQSFRRHDMGPKINKKTLLPESDRVTATCRLSYRCRQQTRRVLLTTRSTCRGETF